MVDLRAKRLRTNMTEAERKLWRSLRSRTTGAKFRRQVPLGPYIADFVAFDAKVIVEVDGGQHATSGGDVKRDQYFKQRGYETIRFWNNDVMQNLDGVMATIVAALHPSPGTSLRDAPPSPSRGEGKRASGEVA